MKNIEQIILANLLKGRVIEAEGVLSENLAQLTNPLAKNIEGIIARFKGDESYAEHLFRESILVDRTFTPAKLNLANSLISQGRYGDALPFAKAGFEESSPKTLQCVLPYLTALLDTAKADEALNIIGSLPDSLKRDRQIQLATASCLRSLGDYSKAISILEALMQQDPSDIIATRIYADVRGEADVRFNPIPFYDRCLELAKKRKKAAIAPIKWNMSLHLLRRREFVRGWEYYDAGLDASVGSLGRSLPAPVRRYSQLDLHSLDRNRWSLIVVEQGIGDQVLFLSALNDIQADLNKIVLICERRMFPILSRSFPSIQLALPGLLEGLEITSFPFNGIAPIGSLQKNYRASIADYTRSKRPFLKVDRKSYNDFRAQLLDEAKGKTIVGISWKGGFWENQQRNKAIELKNWESLFNRNDVYLVNLQYGDLTKDMKWLEERNFHLRTFPEVDFKKDLDTWLSISAACDGIISVSTALVHFAGAVNQKVAVVMPDVQGPWILGIDDTRSIVYPNVHYFRKGARETNDELIQRVIRIIR